MRLISAYIRNFGKFSDCKINLNYNIANYCEENGFGKTTIAAFIKAMLFGLDKNSTKVLSDRAHYYPFNGKTFGGTLTLEYQQKIITIDRIFDKKSPTKDTASVFDAQGNDLKWDPSKIGEKIFEIDVNSFNKTLFISSSDLSFENTTSISQKLNGLVNSGCESYDDIIDKIDETLKKIDRKDNRGSTKSIIKDIDKDIFKLENDLDNLDSLKNSIEEKYNDYQNTQNEINKLSKKRDQISNRKVVVERIIQYQNKQKELSQIEDELNKINEKYPLGLPNQDEMNNLKEYKDADYKITNHLEEYRFTQEEQDEFVSLKTKYHSTPVSEEDINLLKQYEFDLSNYQKFDTEEFEKEKREELNDLTRVFKEKVPSEEEINEVENKIGQYKTNQLKSSSSAFVPSEYKNLEAEFYSNVPSIEELKQIKEKVDSHQELENRKKNYITSFSDSIPQNKNIQLIGLILLIFGLLSIVGGLVLFAFSLIPALITTIVGVILVIPSIILLTRKNKNSNTPIIDKKELLDLDNQIIKLETNLKSYFAQFRMSDSDYLKCYNRLVSDKDNYLRIKETISSNSKGKEEIEKQNKQLEDEITYFFTKYNSLQDTFELSLIKLRSMISKYHNLLKEKEVFDRQKLNNKNKIDETTKLVQGIFKKYYIDENTPLNKEFITLLSKESSLLKSYLDKEYNYQTQLNNKKNNDSLIIDILSKYSISLDNDYQNQYSIIKNDYDLFTRLTNDISRKKEEINNYKMQNNISEEDLQTENDDLDIEEVNNQIQTLNNDLTVKGNEINEIEQQLDNYDSIVNEIKEKSELKEYYKKKYHNLEITKEMFNIAQENLHKKYIGPMEDSFNMYAEKINPIIKEDAKINFSFDVKYLNGTKDHLSEGLKTCLGLSMRFAVIDNMYKSERPFVILDDPFVHLDEENLSKAIDVLKELSKSTQIIYFSCHESRSIK